MSGDRLGRSWPVTGHTHLPECGMIVAAAGNTAGSGRGSDMSLSDVDSIAASIRREEHAVQRGAQLRAAYDRRFCRHGTYVGNPYGADYLCGACEDGED